ncbi:MAG: DUF447 domain-containing protein [Methylococcales bacterium]
MIQETIVTTQNNLGVTHIAPMGVHIEGDDFIILPFKPSTTLDNLLETKVAVLNYTDDVRVFAGCLTGRRDWPSTQAEQIKGQVLACALSHVELEVIKIEDDSVRPRIICKAIHSVNHAAFKGYNRAQHSVLEAAILISRIDWLPIDKIDTEIDYLSIAVEKTAGPKEWEAWEWLMAKIAQHKVGSLA